MPTRHHVHVAVVFLYIGALPPSELPPEPESYLTWCDYFLLTRACLFLLVPSQLFYLLSRTLGCSSRVSSHVFCRDTLLLRVLLSYTKNTGSLSLEPSFLPVLVFLKLLAELIVPDLLLL